MKQFSLKSKIQFICILILVSYIVYSGVVYFNLFIAAKNIQYTQDLEFLQLKIFGSSTTDEVNTISAHFSILDSSGNTITEIERSWNGNYLAIEFNQSEINGKYFIFPSKIFAKNRIIEGQGFNKNGISLEKYYDENNRCILLGRGYTKKDRENLYYISRFTNRQYLVPSFGMVNKYVLDLSDCDPDVLYSVSCDRKGKLTLHRM